MYKQNKGITLSALIIVILVLLILTSVIVDFALDGTLIDKAEETVTKANEKISTDKELEKEMQNSWEEIPGETIQSPTNEDTSIVLTATTSNITKNSFRITVKGKNSEEEMLSFNLTVGDTTYEQKENNDNVVSWDIPNLKNNTYYEFEITASDGKTQNFVKGKVKTLANKIPKLTTKVTDITAETATITATGTDADGDTLTYTLEVNGKTYGPDTKNSWDITGLTEKVRYLYIVTVTDGTDTVEKNGYFTATKDNAAPVIIANTLQSEGSQEFIISATATDENGDNLTYILYTSTSKDSGYSIKATSSETTQGQAVILNSGENISSDQTKYWYIEVSDGTESIESEKQSVIWCTEAKEDVKCSCWTDVPGDWPATADHSYTCDNCGVYVNYYTYHCTYCGFSYGWYISGCSCSGLEKPREGESWTGHEDMNCPGPEQAPDYSCTICGGEGYYNNNCVHGEVHYHAAVGN